MIRALIIDDEKHCSDSLLWQLKQFCPEIEIAGVCNSGEMALQQIPALHPQLVFLDVVMPGMSGFELLEKLPTIDFDIIFTTAFDQYALRAIKLGALDYLVKPVDKDELRVAIDKLMQKTKFGLPKQIAALLTHIRQSNDPSFQKVALPTLHGYELVPIQDIVFCESSSNYTNIQLNNGKKLLISRTLKEIEELLDMANFFRVHNSFLVNLQYAARYIKGEGGSLILHNDISVPVSRNKKDALLKLITHLSV
ncbi:MAG TPA: LytTR family DNA-binding domain-containing protein [Puia sp.]|nr:LytTR family DNA-binding domain-containing protein [Puia sp.]